MATPPLALPPGTRSFRLPGTGVSLRLTMGDITTSPTDAIVNAANEHMLGGSGVDGAIHAAAGPQLLRACRALPLLAPNVRLHTGDAVLLPGGTGTLAARWVIGTAGPIYESPAVSAPALASSVRRSLAVGAGHPDIRSVALPALSCGVYRYPPVDAAALNMRVLAEEAAGGGCLANGGLEEVWFYLFSRPLLDLWVAAAERAFGGGVGGEGVALEPV